MTEFALPTRIERRLCETRGVMKDFVVEDRPYRIEKDVFNERTGTRSDTEVALTDMEIMLAGRLDIFFDKDGSRNECNWPWTGEDKRRKKAAAKPAKKKGGKKAAKKK